MSVAPSIGELRQRFALEAPVDVPDDTGGVLRSWAPLAHVWGRVTPQRGEQRFTADAMETAITHLVTIRARPDVANGMRFRLGARALLIRAVIDPDESGRFFLCRCEEFAP